jgi:hypothetical protein
MVLRDQEVGLVIHDDFLELKPFATMYPVELNDSHGSSRSS